MSEMKRDPVVGKTELVSEVSKSIGDKDLSKKMIEDVINGVIHAIRENLKAGRKVNLVGLGNLSCHLRETREGRNPRTGEVIKIAAKKAISFKAAKGLKELIN